MNPSKTILILIALLSANAIAQESFGRKSPSVTMAPVPVESVTRGKSGTIALRFRVASGFHINSNTPKEEYLIPTDLKLDPPTDIIVGKVTYPPGVDAAGKIFFSGRIEISGLRQRRLLSAEEIAG